MIYKEGVFCFVVLVLVWFCGDLVVIPKPPNVKPMASKKVSALRCVVALHLSFQLVGQRIVPEFL